MNDIIKFENGQLVKEAVDLLVIKEQQMKQLKEEYEQMKNDLLEAMEQNGVIKIDTDKIAINYIAPTESERFDSKKFREDMPDLYDEYVKFTPVKASVRIKVKL